MEELIVSSATGGKQLVGEGSIKMLRFEAVYCYYSYDGSNTSLKKNLATIKYEQ